MRATQRLLASGESYNKDTKEWSAQVRWVSQGLPRSRDLTPVMKIHRHSTVKQDDKVTPKEVTQGRNEDKPTKCESCLSASPTRRVQKSLWEKFAGGVEGGVQGQGRVRASPLLCWGQWEDQPQWACALEMRPEIVMDLLGRNPGREDGGA